ncbi:MAG: hypothetical protein AAGA09_01045 [Pseudomonadota bacterium]
MARLTFLVLLFVSLMTSAATAQIELPDGLSRDSKIRLPKDPRLEKASPVIELSDAFIACNELQIHLAPRRYASTKI